MTGNKNLVKVVGDLKKIMTKMGLCSASGVTTDPNIDSGKSKLPTVPQAHQVQQTEHILNELLKYVTCMT
jgi:hypothetical protein